MKYAANYRTLEGVHMVLGIQGDNKRKLEREIKDVARGECLAGSSVSWYVYDARTRMVECGGLIKKSVEGRFSYPLRINN